MNNEELQKKLEELETKIDAVYRSAEKTRKYFLVIIWVTIILFVLPLIGLLFIVPSFFSIYTNTLNGLGI